MADCILPIDIMLNIQSRLPVKSIIRFKSVCKPWLSLFSSPQFKKLHRSQFSSDTKNQTVIFYEMNKNNMSFLNIQCGIEKKPTIIDCPHLENRKRDFVGCYNGLVCMVFRYSWPHQVVVIWNPAMKLFKSLWLKRPQMFSAIPLVSLGFGYDSDADDYKVVRIFYFEEITFSDDVDDDDEYTEDVAVVEVYSLNSNSCVTLRLDFQFDVSRLKNDVIVNGNPFWVAKVNGKDVLVYCDVTNLVCKIVPLPTFYVKGKVTLVDWKGALGALVCANENERVFKSLVVWVFDGVANIWNKNYTFDPVEGINVDRYLYGLNDGKFIGEHSDGKLFVIDPDNGRVEEILIDVDEEWGLQVHGYVESLARVQGMKGELEVEEVNDGDDRTRRFRAGMEDFFMCFPHLRV